MQKQLSGKLEWLTITRNRPVQTSTLRKTTGFFFSQNRIKFFKSLIQTKEDTLTVEFSFAFLGSSHLGLKFYRIFTNSSFAPHYFNSRYFFKTDTNMRYSNNSVCKNTYILEHFINTVKIIPVQTSQIFK